MEYYILLEKLLKAISKLEGFDLEEIYQVIGELCKLFRTSKAVTEYYNTPEEENRGAGEVFVAYDDGRGGRPVLTQRIVSENRTVVRSTVYMTDDVEPWTQEERERVSLVERIIIAFIGRSRLERITFKLKNYDSDGFLNLHYFRHFIEGTAEKNSLAGMAAVDLNLRRFSLINQQIGRSAANNVLHNFFEMMTDIVGDDGCVCRVTGDRFMVLCDADFLDEILTMLEGIPILYDVNYGESVQVSASAGVYVFPEDFEFTDTQEIIDCLFLASQIAKAGEQGDFVYYTQEVAENKEKAMWVEHVFQDAITQEEFQVYYQPKIDVYTGRIAGAEALCRWFHEGKMVMPGEFIPVLEQSRKICQLDFYMLEHVCQDIRRWLDEGRQVVRISVNLSRKHMLDMELFTQIVSIIDRYNIPHQYMEIELTETTTDVEFKDLKQIVQQFQRVGIYVSVDDFGMGYSSLNLIKEIPWDVLKVDRSFLPDMEKDDTDIRSVMFKHVVAMAKALGFECVAEGVEKRQQIDLLREYHCDLAQGFFFDRPIPLNEFEERLDRETYSLG